MRGSQQHLSTAELEQLAGSGEVPAGVLEEAMNHLDSCFECRLLILQPAGIDLSSSPEASRDQKPVVVGPCPPDGKWMELATGILPQEEHEFHLQHALRCVHCGPLLKIAAEDLATELTPEEERRVAALDSAQPHWQVNLAQKIAPKSHSGRLLERPSRFESAGWRPSYWRWSVPAAALLLFAFAGLVGYESLRTRQIDDLLAIAYTEQRTIEPRISGADYNSMADTRRALESASPFNYPTSLLKAESLINKRLEKHPDDAGLLDEKGRAALLENEYATALEALQRAHAIDPKSGQIATDLATVYIEQGIQKESVPAEAAAAYAKAIELLSAALSTHPAETIALFNRAMAYERAYGVGRDPGLLKNSILDWQHYLAVDQSGKWHDEAQRHLAGLIQAEKPTSN